MVTLRLCVAATLSWSLWSFLLSRVLTAACIGGEYSAINSAIDELTPARVRGWVAPAANGNWWRGTAVGAAVTISLLDPNLVPYGAGRPLCFGSGAVPGLLVLVIRRLSPESPRRPMTHGRMEEAEHVVGKIERTVRFAFTTASTR